MTTERTSNYLSCPRSFPVDLLIKCRRLQAEHVTDTYKLSSADGSGGDTGTFIPVCGHRNIMLFMLLAKHHTPSGYLTWINDLCPLSGQASLLHPR